MYKEKYDYINIYIIYGIHHLIYMSNEVDFKCIYLMDSIDLGSKVHIGGKKSETNFIEVINNRITLIIVSV